MGGVIMKRFIPLGWGFGGVFWGSPRLGCSETLEPCFSFLTFNDNSFTGEAVDGFGGALEDGAAGGDAGGAFAVVATGWYYIHNNLVLSMPRFFAKVKGV